MISSGVPDQACVAHRLGGHELALLGLQKVQVAVVDLPEARILRQAEVLAPA